MQADFDAGRVSEVEVFSELLRSNLGVAMLLSPARWKAEAIAATLNARSLSYNWRWLRDFLIIPS